MDETFPPNDTSIYAPHDCENHPPVVWYRATDLSERPCLFSDGKISNNFVQV